MYRDAADAELKWLLRHPSPGKPTLPAWDEQAAWNTTTDTPIHRAIDRPRGPIRGWMLWDRCFELEPAASAQMVLGLRDIPSAPSARSDGFSIRAWRPRTITLGMKTCLRRLRRTWNGCPSWSTPRLVFRHRRAVRATPPPPIGCPLRSTAAALHGACLPLSQRLGALAARMDQAFCALPHDLSGHGGFALRGGAPTTNRDRNSRRFGAVKRTATRRRKWR